MKEETRGADVRRYAQRLQKYLQGLEEIPRIIKEEIAAGQVDVDSLLGKILDCLKKVFNSDIAFTADEEGKIIRSDPISFLAVRFPIEFVTDVLFKTNEDTLVISDTTGYPVLNELKIDSIMILKSWILGKSVWIGVCNGHNKTEPFLGEDKKFFKLILDFIDSVYEYVIKSEEWGDLYKYNSARQTGNWADIARTSLELVNKHNKIEKIPVFMDARLCETMLKTSLRQETGNLERGQITHIDKENKTFSVRIPGVEGDKVLPIAEHKMAALAGARNLLYDLFNTLNTEAGGEPTQAAGPAGNPCQDWIEYIVGQTEPQEDMGEKDFDCRVDWLRTQWLRIHYLARSADIRLSTKDGDTMRSIYGDTWEKTVALIQNHLKHNPAKPAGADTITIDSDWLLAFLAQNALLSRSLNEHYRLIDIDTGYANPLSGARFFKRLSRFILYILHYIRFAGKEAEYERDKSGTARHERFKRPPFADVPLKSDTSLSSSIIFMVSEYAYREIGVPRELLIFEKLSQQLNFELPLYASSEFYRDHCYHVIDVCLLGEFLLSCDLSASPNMGERAIFKGRTDPKRPNYLKNWYMAGLCHDLGYVVERVEKLVGPIEKLNTPALAQFNRELKKGLTNGTDKLKEDIISLCRERDLGIDRKLKAEILRRTETLDHGIIAWLYLVQVMKKLDIPLNSMKDALKAILRHNMTDHDGHIQNELLSLLLILCDHLQEWGRPRVATEQLATGVMETMRFSPQESYLDRQVHLNQFSIKELTLENPKKAELPAGICDRCINSASCKEEDNCQRCWPVIRQGTLEFQFDYHGDSLADFEPVLSWLFFCPDFQCRDFPFGKCLFPIAIRFSHPLSTRPRFSIDAIPELDIFEEFANTFKDEEVAYLCRWIECARKNKDGIEYKYTPATGDQKSKEEFIIHLERLGRPLSRGLDQRLRDKFKKWKKEWRG